MKDLPGAHLAIIGLGLMGGSLAASLYSHCSRITGIDQNQESLDYALDKRWIDDGYSNLKDGLSGVDAIILATPVRTILRYLDELASILDQECMVMDLGSTKREIVQRMASLPANIHSIGGHPMCGREVSGVFQADPEIYRGRPFILVPHSQTSDEMTLFANQIIHRIAAYPVSMDPIRHDRLVAAVSHLPYLLACGLVAAAEVTGNQDNEIIWEIAASGFQDTSRLAASDITMMVDILLTNRKAILNAVNLFQHQLDKLEHLIAAEEEEMVRDILVKIFERRKQLNQ